jgi:opacity protein-like surface antigen
MKGRFLLIILLLSFSIGAGAQTVESICSSADYLWAEGRDVRPSLADNKAIDNLLAKLSASDILPVADWLKGPLWKTYRTDVRSSTQTLTTPNGVLRYIAWRDIDKVFGNRWRKVRELVQWAQKSATQNPDASRTYLYWADTYLASLPPADPALRRQVTEIKAQVGVGRTDAVHLRNIESEIGLIQKALKAQKPAVKEPLKPVEAPITITRDTTRVIEAANWTAIPPKNTVRFASSPGVIPRREAPAETAAAQKPSWNGALLLQADFWAAPSFGVMLTVGYGKIGAYISARSNFSSNGYAYECRQDGTCDFGRFWASGNSRCHRLSLAAGPVYAFHKHFSAYAGLGYGQQNILWEDSSGSWARVSDLSARGLILDAGVLWSPGRIVIGAGASLTAFRAPSGIISIGLKF